MACCMPVTLWKLRQEDCRKCDGCLERECKASLNYTRSLPPFPLYVYALCSLSLSLPSIAVCAPACARVHMIIRVETSGLRSQICGRQWDVILDSQHAPVTIAMRKGDETEGGGGWLRRRAPGTLRDRPTER